IVEVCKVIVAVLGIVVMIIGGPLAWVVLAAALVVLADTLIKYAKGEAGLLDVAFAALDCIPGMKGLTTLGGLARGLKGLASTGLRGLRQGALRLGRRTRGDGVPMNGRNACGDPVDVATGELLMSATDVDLPGVLPLVVERHHISSYRAGRWFGSSWASTLDQRLVLDEHGARLFTADGMTLLYPRPIPGEPVFPVEGPRWSLSWDGQPLAPMSVHQPASGQTLHFAPVEGRPGSELPLIAITDRNNNRIQLAYDNTGAPTDIHHSGGYHLGITTTDGRVTALTLLSDPDEPTLLAYGYDTAGLLAEITNSSGRPLKFSYDEHARMSRWEDRNGYWYSYAYDEQGRCVYTTGTDRALEYRYAYDEETHRTVVTDSLGHDSVFQFNDSYQLNAHTDPLGQASTREWDRYDRTLTVTDPLGHTTRYEHDDHGNVTVLTRPDGSQARAEYNEWGLVTQLTQPDGAVWRQSYDASGNRTTLLGPTGHRTTFTYHPGGGLASVTDPLDRTLRVDCDGAGLPIALTDPLGATTRFRRDASGRVIEQRDPLGATRALAWTVEGKPVRDVDANGVARHWVWDGEGNCLEHVDAQGGVTRYTYGAFDLPVSIEGPDGSRQVVERDTELRITAVAASAGRRWTFTHDAAGRVVAETDADGRTTTYLRDAAGRPVARTNAAGETVAYRYDPLGQLVEKTLPDGRTTTFDRDPMGRALHAATDGVEVSRRYDPQGQLLTETVNGRPLSLGYDAAGQQVTRTTPSRHTSAWSYDLAGRTVSMSAGRHTFAFERDAAGREVVRTLDDALTWHQHWDPAGQLLTQSVARPGAGDVPLSRRSYTYRADGHPTGVDDGTGAVRFALDPVGRVLGLTGPAGAETYRYDEHGNQVSARWSTPDPESGMGDRAYEGTTVIRAGALSYGYDAAGRTVLRRRKRLSHKAEVWRYAWDAEDRLTRVTTPDGTVWRYHYDPFGRRIAKERLAEDGHTVVERTDFTWQNTLLVEQTSTGVGHRGPTTLTWDHGESGPVAQTESFAGAAENEVARRFFAIVTDLVGTPTELLAEDGTTAWRAEVSLWGVPRTNTDHGSAATTTPLRFPGQYADAETGWHYNHYRHYDPVTARYATPDPLGIVPQPNAYAYPHHPLAWSDPLGLAPHGNGIVSTTQDVEQNLASITDRAIGDGFSGVYNPSTRALEARVSSEPGALVDRFGGHGQINREVFGESGDAVGFVAIRTEAGLEMRWRSASVNVRNFGNREAPMEHRQDIRDVLESITGLTTHERA
ncbi:hypothetical protein FH609_030060, partial [Streptomyces sp. 3MP-14]